MRRHVFYISGFDPRGPAYYHTLYRDESRKQSLVNGLQIECGPRRRISDLETAWTVTSREADVEYSFLRYDDLMRARWSRTNASVLRDVAHYVWLLLNRGVFHKVLMTSWPTFVTMSYPPTLVLGALILVIVCAAFGWFLGGPLLAAITFAIMAGALLFLRSRLEGQTNAFWLSRILSFIADQGSGEVPQFEERIDRFAERILACLLEEKPDEVLIVGHSVGSQLAVSAAARLEVRLDGKRPPGTALSLLTLGHTIPLQALQRGAKKFRDELQLVNQAEEIDWIDVSAAIDSACFPLCDPITASGLRQSNPAVPKPKLVSARFPKLFTPESYAKLRRDFSRAHFQYLLSSEKAGDYDYFLITAGNKLLAERYAHLTSVQGFDRFRLRKP